MDTSTNTVVVHFILEKIVLDCVKRVDKIGNDEFVVIKFCMKVRHKGVYSIKGVESSSTAKLPIT